MHRDSIRQLIKIIATETNPHQAISRVAAEARLLSTARDIHRAHRHKDNGTIKEVQKLCLLAHLNPDLFLDRIHFIVHTLKPEGFDHENLYEQLELEPTATLEEIKTAFRRLSLLHHPDRNPGNPQAVDRFLQISNAYKILSHEKSREAYDRSLAVPPWHENPLEEEPARPQMDLLRQVRRLRRLWPFAVPVFLLVGVVLFVDFHDLQSSRYYEGQRQARSPEPAIRTLPPNEEVPEEAEDTPPPPGAKILQERLVSLRHASNPAAALLDGPAPLLFSSPFRHGSDPACFTPRPSSLAAIPETRESGTPKSSRTLASTGVTGRNHTGSSAPNQVGEAAAPLNRTHVTRLRQPMASQPGKVPSSPPSRERVLPRSDVSAPRSAVQPSSRSSKPSGLSAAPRPQPAREPQKHREAPLALRSPEPKPSHSPRSPLSSSSSPVRASVPPPVTPAEKEKEALPARAASPVVVPTPSTASLQRPESKKESSRPLQERLEDFLQRYTSAYENKDSRTFFSFFEPNALENGEPFRSLQPLYLENFRKARGIQYGIRLVDWSESPQGISMEGTFRMTFQFSGRRPVQSWGVIRMELVPRGEAFRVKRLDYHFH